MSQIFQSPLIAYDNSSLSLIILDIIDSMKHHFSKINILHVHNPKKLYIQDFNRGPGVYQKLQDRYNGPQHKNVQIDLKEMGEKNTNMIILQTFVARSSSILFLGFVGSKGFKPRNKDLSSRIRQFVYESKLNLAIIKHADRQLGKILFLCDGSEVSLDGLTHAIAFCKSFNKQLFVLHTFNEDLKKYSKHVRTLLKTAQQSNKDFKFQVILEQSNLIEAVESRHLNYDWIIVNKNGYRAFINKQRFVGSNTSSILENINTNLILLN